MFWVVTTTVLLSESSAMTVNWSVSSFCTVILAFLHLSFVVLLMDWYSWHTMASIVVAVLSKMVTGISRLYRIGSRITWLALLVSVFISLMVRPSLRSCTFLLNVILSNFSLQFWFLWPTPFFECNVIKNFCHLSIVSHLLFRSESQTHWTSPMIGYRCNRIPFCIRALSLGIYLSLNDISNFRFSLCDCLRSYVEW